jgi:hypothetical protein
MDARTGDLTPHEDYLADTPDGAWGGRIPTARGRVFVLF